MKFLFALLPVFVFIVSHAPDARAKGGDMGNAGDLVVREFSLTAQDIFNRMKLLPDSELAGIDMNRLQGAILNVEIISRETLVNPVNDNEVPALNYPEKNLLIINRRMWAPLRLKEQTESRYALVLHEFLYLVGIDDQEFHKSNHLIEMLGVKEFNSGRIWNPLNPVNRISTNLIFNPGECVLKGLDFDTQAQEEDKQEATTGNCGEAYRRVSVKKASFQAPPSSGWKGLFHRYEITVSDGSGKELGQVTVEPEWGKCLLPQDGGCAVGGKFFTGGVEFRFWFQR